METITETQALYTALDQPLAAITVRQLKNLIRDIIADYWHPQYYLDERGYLVFATEDAYATYLRQQGNRAPSEVRARFIDEQGFRRFYSDWEPTPAQAVELDQIEAEIAAGGQVYDLETIIAELGLADADV